MALPHRPGSGELIDFADLAAALLQRAPQLLPQWLPGGQFKGHEYVCADLGGGEGGSLSVNVNTGVWADFAGDDRGGDLISLYAAIHNLNQGQAARQLMAELGWQRAGPASVQTPAPRDALPTRSLAERFAEKGLAPPDAAEGDGAGGGDDGPPMPPPVDADTPGPGKRKSVWRAIAPVPVYAPPADFRHWHYTDVAASWEYRFEGVLYGHVVRFNTSDGGKEILPHTWCVDESDARGTQRWHWKQWDSPRPLYVPATLLSGTPRDVPVVLVEGEKCALAGHVLLGHEFDFVSWPGGSNAWAKAAWGWLMGRTVYLWPDADAKRKRLTPAEREAGTDPATKPLLPEALQPGMKAMVSIGSLLVADQACTVLLCPIPKPDKVATDGWDIADAIAGGWTAEDVRGFIRGAHAFVPPSDEARAKVGAAESISTPSRAGATPDEDSEPVTDWRKHLIERKGVIAPVRENVVLALDGMALERGFWVPGVVEAAGVIAFNEFTNDVVKLRDSPWGTPAGVWDEADALLMGEWLVRQHWLPSLPLGTLEEAVRMVAYRHRYHPVRARLEGLRGRWDKVSRLATWLRRCVLEEDEFDDAAPLQQYLARVGTWLLMGMCARVLTPGCKFDYMVIFEGPQGVGKSTLTSVLGGAFHADTGLMLGDKDSYQNLQGVWVYELGELDAMSKSEVSKVKLFVASKQDRFRASFDRRAKNYPRQLVFIGTVNEDHYLTDSTGNRRFWPVRVTRQVDLAWLRENLDQMLAEALECLAAGQRFHPTTREERELFAPQQQQRMVESAIESAIARYLYDENQPVSPTGENGVLVQEVTLIGLLSKVGIGLEKLGPGRFHEKQAAAALRRLGWVEGRSSKPGRARVYRRPNPDLYAGAPPTPPAPPSSSTGPSTGPDDSEDPDGPPF